MFDFDIYKENLLSKFDDNLKEVINKNHSLPHLEKGIRDLSKKGENYSLLVKAYTANVYITAREYKNNIGDKFKVFKEDDFIKDCLSSKYLFNEDGYYIGESENTIVAVEIEKDITLDLCFGSYQEIKSNIVSSIFVLFHRKDITDIKLFEILYQWKSLQTFKEKKNFYKYLLDKKLVFRREN